MNRTRSRSIGRLLIASALFGCLLRAAPPHGQRWKPDIPKVWDEAALADWATPLAGLNLRPTHISAKDYYSLTVENLRTYPVYFPGREPDGYWEMLQQTGPKPLIEPKNCKQRPTGSRRVGGYSTKPIICTCARWIPRLSPQPGAARRSTRQAWNHCPTARCSARGGCRRSRVWRCRSETATTAICCIGLMVIASLALQRSPKYHARAIRNTATH